MSSITNPNDIKPRKTCSKIPKFKQHDAIEDWIDIVRNKKINCNEEMFLLCDLVEKKCMSEEVIVKVELIDKAINLVEKYRPYKMTPFQKFLTACIVGLYKTDDSVLFRESFIYAGRGFGKNSFASDLTFFLTSKQYGVEEYNVDIVANSEDQAMTSFYDIYNIIDKHKYALEKAYNRTKEDITNKTTRSTIKYHTSNSKTADGLRPGLVLFDEVHEYATYDNLKVYTSALGKVQHGRILYLTTDGYVREGVLDTYKQLALDILHGKADDIDMLPVICKIDDPNDWEDSSKWEMANPNLPWLPNLQIEMKAAYAKAKRILPDKIEFITKRLNSPLQDPTRLVATYEQIRAASIPLPYDLLKGKECIGGVDYADIRDFIGVGLLFKIGDKRYWVHHTFIVEASLKLKTYNPALMEQAKAKGGYTVVPGETMNPLYITEWFKRMAKTYRIKTIIADRFRSGPLREAFMNEGLPFEDVPVGPPTHNKLAPTIDDMFAGHKFFFEDEPMMRWFIANVKVVMDAKGNKTYLKIEPELRKTDGFFALLHAMTKDNELTAVQPKYRPYKSYTYS